MKIVFRNLPEGDGTVKVSLDGGNTFIDHQINTVRENGIPLADSQDYSKILIKGSANILRNLDILSSVKVDGAAQSTGTTYKAWTWEMTDQVIYTKDGSDVVYRKTSDNTVEEEAENVYEHTEDNGIERIRTTKHKGYWYRTSNLDFIINEQTVGIPYTYEKPVYELGTVYKCYAYDQNKDEQITDDDNVPNYYHFWVKTIDGKDTVYGINQSGFETDVSNLVELSKLEPPLPAEWIANITINEDIVVFADEKYIRYPEGDLSERIIVGTETVTEVIKFIQDPPTVTENGTVIADEGKAFKLANVEVPKSELGFKCFFNYAPEHYFGEVPQASLALDSGKRNYNILMSNDYLKNLCSNAFPGRTYNGVVGIYNDGDRQGFVSNHYTLNSEYNLFKYYTNVGTDTLLLYFYDNLTSQDSFSTVRVSLIDGSRIVPE